MLEVLQKEGIAIDMIAGTSAGAIIGSLYAQGKDTNQIKKIALDLTWKQLAPLMDLTLPKTGIIAGKKIQSWLRSIIGGEILFSDLGIPFACVATDIMTGEEVVLNEGSVVEALRASISIPGLFAVVKSKGKYLVDGILVNPVPVSVLKSMGADFIIAVNVIPNISARDESHWIAEKKEKPKEPDIFHILMQSIYIGTHTLAKSCLKDADIAIEPKVAHISPGDFHRAEECIQHGMLAAQEAMPVLKRKLQAWNRSNPLNPY
ncbi:patatin-like phospholipase family protein [Chloroflexota bacterium]